MTTFEVINDVTENKVKFRKNGLEVCGLYIPFHSISHITDVEIGTCYNSKYSSFYIHLQDQSEIELTSPYVEAPYKKCEQQYVKIGPFKFKKERKHDHEKLDEWLRNTTLDMYESVSIMRCVRNKILEKLDKWDGN